MIRVESVFISPSGEWRLGGFDLMSNPTDQAAVLYVRHMNTWSMLFTYMFVCSQWVNVQGRSNALKCTSLAGVCLKSKETHA